MATAAQFIAASRSWGRFIDAARRLDAKAVREAAGATIILLPRRNTAGKVTTVARLVKAVQESATRIAGNCPEHWQRSYGLQITAIVAQLHGVERDAFTFYACLATREVSDATRIVPADND